MSLGSNQFVVLLHYESANKWLSGWPFLYSRIYRGPDLSFEKKSVEYEREEEVRFRPR